MEAEAEAEAEEDNNAACCLRRDATVMEIKLPTSHSHTPFPLSTIAAAEARPRVTQPIETFARNPRQRSVDPIPLHDDAFSRTSALFPLHSFPVPAIPPRTQRVNVSM